MSRAPTGHGPDATQLVRPHTLVASTLSAQIQNWLVRPIDHTVDVRKKESLSYGHFAPDSLNFLFIDTFLFRLSMEAAAQEIV